MSARWYSEDPRTNAQVDYNAADTKSLEDSYNGRKQAVSLTLGGTRFTVDVKAMTQSNNSGGSRKVKRVQTATTSANSETEKQVVIKWLKEHMDDQPNAKKPGHIIVVCNQDKCGNSYQLKDDWTGYYCAVKHLETKHGLDRPSGAIQPAPKKIKQKTTPVSKKKGAVIDTSSSDSSDYSSFDDCDDAIAMSKAKRLPKKAAAKKEKKPAAKKPEEKKPSSPKKTEPAKKPEEKKPSSPKKTEPAKVASSGSGGNGAIIKVLQYNILEQGHRPESLQALCMHVARKYPLATFQEVCGHDMELIQAFLANARSLVKGTPIEGKEQGSKPPSKTTMKMANELCHVHMKATDAHHKGHNAVMYDDRRWSPVLAGFDIEVDLGGLDSGSEDDDGGKSGKHKAHHTIPMMVLQSVSSGSVIGSLIHPEPHTVVALGSYHTPGASASRKRRAKQNAKVFAAIYSEVEDLLKAKKELRGTEVVFMAIGDGNFQQLYKNGPQELRDNTFTLCEGLHPSDRYLHLPEAEPLGDNDPLGALMPASTTKDTFVANPEVGCFTGVLGRKGVKRGARPLAKVEFDVQEPIMCSDHEPCLVTAEV